MCLLAVREAWYGMSFLAGFSPLQPAQLQVSTVAIQSNDGEAGVAVWLTLLFCASVTSLVVLGVVSYYAEMFEKVLQAMLLLQGSFKLYKLPRTLAPSVRKVLEAKLQIKLIERDNLVRAHATSN